MTKAMGQADEQNQISYGDDKALRAVLDASRKDRGRVQSGVTNHFARCLTLRVKAKKIPPLRYGMTRASCLART